MDKYVIIFCVVFAAIIIAGVIAAVVKTGKSNGYSGIFKVIRKNAGDDSNENKRHEATTVIRGAARNILKRNGWKVEVLAKEDDKVLAEGFFDREFFNLEPYAEAEKHYTIGRSGISDLVVSPSFKDVGNKHGYVRYDLSSGEYVYWDNKSKFGTFTDENEGDQINERHITVSDGLKLYISKDVYIKFSKTGNQEN